jgi:hypothetical protein
MRQAGAAGTFAAHTDYISDMAAHAPERALLATSGDGTLSVNDPRTFKVGVCRRPALACCSPNSFVKCVCKDRSADTTEQHQQHLCTLPRATQVLMSVAAVNTF